MKNLVERLLEFLFLSRYVNQDYLRIQISCINKMRNQCLGVAIYIDAKTLKANT